MCRPDEAQKQDFPLALQYIGLISMSSVFMRRLHSPYPTELRIQIVSRSEIITLQRKKLFWSSSEGKGWGLRCVRDLAGQLNKITKIINDHTFGQLGRLTWDPLERERERQRGGVRQKNTRKPRAGYNNSHVINY